MTLRTTAEDLPEEIRVQIDNFVKRYGEILSNELFYGQPTEPEIPSEPSRPQVRDQPLGPLGELGTRLWGKYQGQDQDHTQRQQLDGPVRKLYTESDLVRYK